MSGKRNVSVCRGHELANALYKLVLQWRKRMVKWVHVPVGFMVRAKSTLRGKKPTDEYVNNQMYGKNPLGVLKLNRPFG